MKVSQIFFTGPRKYFPTNETAGCWWCGVVSGVCGARRMTGGWWLRWLRLRDQSSGRAVEWSQDQWNESWLLLLLPHSRAMFGPPSPWRSRGGGAGRWEASSTSTSTAQPSRPLGDQEPLYSSRVFMLSFKLISSQIYLYRMMIK